MLVRVRVQAWAPVMGAGADMGGTIEGTDADAVAAWVVVAARWRGGCRRAGAVVGLVLAPSDVCVGSPALRLGRLVASSPRDASTSLPLLSVLSSLGRKQRWWRCCSQGLRGRVGRSETTGGYVARLWGRGHMLPHFRSAQLTPTAPHRGPRPPRHGADLPGPGFPTRIPLLCLPTVRSLRPEAHCEQPRVADIIVEKRSLFAAHSSALAHLTHTPCRTATMSPPRSVLSPPSHD